MRLAIGQCDTYLKFSKPSQVLTSQRRIDPSEDPVRAVEPSFVNIAVLTIDECPLQVIGKNKHAHGVIAGCVQHNKCKVE